VGEIYQYPVDEGTTVETLLTDWVWKEKYFQKEPDHSLYWLYKHVERSDNFDICLSKDKKIMKFLFKSERERQHDPEQQQPAANGKRFSFM
jgi:hypothetical protein